jgi:hypothetical protein
MVSFQLRADLPPPPPEQEAEWAQESAVTLGSR